MIQRTVATPTGSLAASVDPGRAWRVGYRPDPWAWTPWQWERPLGDPTPQLLSVIDRYKLGNHHQILAILDPMKRTSTSRR